MGECQEVYCTETENEKVDLLLAVGVELVQGGGQADPQRGGQILFWMKSTGRHIV